MSTDQFFKSHNALVPYPTMHHSEQKCAHFCSEWCIVGYGTGALWELWTRPIDLLVLKLNCIVGYGTGALWELWIRSTDFLVLKLYHPSISRSILWLMMSWILVSPDHLQPLHWPGTWWRINGSLSSIHEEGFQLPLPSKYREIREKNNKYFCLFVFYSKFCLFVFYSKFSTTRIKKPLGMNRQLALWPYKQGHILSLFITFMAAAYWVLGSGWGHLNAGTLRPYFSIKSLFYDS